MLAKLLMSFAFVVSLRAQGLGQLAPQNESKRESTIQALTPAGLTPISVRLMELDAKYPNGKTGKGTICVYYDRNTGLYLWDFLMWLVKYPIPPSEKHFMYDGKVFVANNQIVQFRPESYVQSSDVANSLEEALSKSVTAATSTLQRGESALIFPRKGSKWRFPPDFYVPPYNSKGVRLAIIDVQRNNSQWQLTVQGVWKEVITLDDNLQFVGHAPAPGETPKYWTKGLPPHVWGR